MPMNPDAESYKLRFGPYHPPRVQVGDEIQCEVRGLVTVADWSDRGEIMWPRCKTTGKRAMVLMGDLVTACRSETQIAVARHWNVSLLTVQKWKRAIGAPARTLVTEAVSSLKSHLQRSGNPVPPQTRAALLRAAKKPKSEDWKRQAAEWLAKAAKPELK